MNPFSILDPLHFNRSLFDSSYGTHPRPSTTGILDLPGYCNDIEDEMIRAAIEASKKDVEQGYPKQFVARNDLIAPHSQQRKYKLDEVELARAGSLSLKRKKRNYVKWGGGRVEHQNWKFTSHLR